MINMLLRTIGFVTTSKNNAFFPNAITICRIEKNNIIYELKLEQ